LGDVLLVILSYFIGAIPFSYIIGRVFAGIDLREKGSGNVGATNAMRNMGIGLGLASLAGDLLKGVLAAWLGLHYGGETLAAFCGAMAAFAHCYTIFLGFRGGKAVATSAGVVLMLMPRVLVVLFFLLVIIVVITRYVSLGSVSAAAILPVMAVVLHSPRPYVYMSGFLAVLVIYRHRENIRRLREGTESKLGKP